jgi:hypothetical protein
MPSLASTHLARAALALFDLRLGHASMQWALDQAAAMPGGVAGLVQSLVDVGAGHAALADTLVRHVGFRGAAAEAAVLHVAARLDAAGAGHEGETVLALLAELAQATAHADPEIATVARAFARSSDGALAHAALDGSVDMAAHGPASAAIGASVDATTGTLRLTGGQSVRIDLTNPARALVGIDLDGDGVIERDGVESAPSNVIGGFTVIDAYPRNPLDVTDTVNNFTGSIWFDGTGHGGDGNAAPVPLIAGGSGDDILRGGAGAQQLFGGAGRDRIDLGDADRTRDVLILRDAAEGGDIVFGFEPGVDRIRLAAALDQQLDDARADNRLAWFTTDGIGFTRQAVDLRASEAIAVAARDAHLAAESIGDLSLVAAALNKAVALHNAAGGDVLFSLAAEDADNIGALLLWRDADGDDAIAAAELTLLGVIATTGAALGSADVVVG